MVPLAKASELAKPGVILLKGRSLPKGRVYLTTQIQGNVNKFEAITATSYDRGLEAGEWHKLLHGAALPVM